MKVAYCLSGFMRNYKNNNFLENMVNKVPGDIFIHTWDELVPGTPLNSTEINFYYNSHGSIIENQKDFKAHLGLDRFPEHIQNYICMWKSIWSAINMAKDYDVIVRFRPDLKVESVLQEKDVLNAWVNKEQLYIGLSDDCYHAGILTDNFAVGSKEAMSIYADHYLHSFVYRLTHDSNERALSGYLNQYRNKLKFKPCNLKYRLKRMNEELIPNSQYINELHPVWQN